MREDVEGEIREEFESDPEIGGAKGVLSAIADMVAAYRGETDGAAARDAIKASELKVSEANRERDEAIDAGRSAAHLLYIERQIGRHPMVKTIRNHFKGRKFEDLEEAKKALEICLSELPKSEDVVTKEESKVREENAELRGKITLLEGKVDELSDKLQKAVTLGQRIDSQRIAEVEEANEEISSLESELKEAVDQKEAAESKFEEARREFDNLMEEKELANYKLEKVAGLTNGRELIGLMESVHDRAGVDEMVEKRGLREVADPELQRMRESLGKGRTGKSMRIEEEATAEPTKSVDELGNDMFELVTLAGIPGNG
jgi:chromosome segregation ATPase